MAVLVTRPDERGQQLVDMLAKAGVVAIHLPLFRIESGAELNELPNKFAQLKSGDYVFAVSKSAVDFAFKTLTATGFLWRWDLHYFTVGQGTAQYFTAMTEMPVHYPTAQENSEGLLQLSAMRDLSDKTVLILRGNGGRELFAEQAQQRGANVEIVECYRREPIVYNNAEQTSICKRAGIQTIVATSAEILTQLVDFVPQNEHNWLKSCQLITVSERIAHLAEALGWQNVVISPRADNQTLLQTLLQCR
ncbi:uroporphyrinogen-III synthase [Aggregatibacter actinomycetemcomitans]|uniref:uroporphyrinogen-III synthase n=1 Tax=Aggregatibacter actinomycetemcomitans TaxID=714 RepID=UPI0011DA3129|nr:uroporphyrinogen-III synthase [Aggregatibacter actinomycetemcomitans]QEH46540.1 uroporphyrinogen-III synthase [Aggregatibacter actinomycetemcomitans]QEH48807.1 uroporphyrinogen-III synthase [Aggregatibacter actinomycetemcomitans]TYA49717.1 uroporphyrinogen-III synthase [Aggregatibacter actinomycetemcomitans]TYA52116.1 uroporphyrinogen-III synthase [Aggregatibacter actinomycetemcomitans]TYB30123.1 uroporphyrinogen-III synthase [Aggregatibacter actinomycetemcomitans]